MTIEPIEIRQARMEERLVSLVGEVRLLRDDQKKGFGEITKVLAEVQAKVGHLDGRIVGIATTIGALVMLANHFIH